MSDPLDERLHTFARELGATVVLPGPDDAKRRAQRRRVRHRRAAAMAGGVAALAAVAAGTWLFTLAAPEPAPPTPPAASPPPSTSTQPPFPAADTLPWHSELRWQLSGDEDVARRADDWWKFCGWDDIAEGAGQASGWTAPYEAEDESVAAYSLLEYASEEEAKEVALALVQGGRCWPTMVHDTESSPPQPSVTVVDFGPASELKPSRARMYLDVVDEQLLVLTVLSDALPTDEEEEAARTVDCLTGLVAEAFPDDSACPTGATGTP
ncbi:hypothetical protein [Streptomyces marincola]|uniref:Uncharacterized protein n=1 Tax=Streptomyces marincola TaxID=2878388 RepID=A0A1W7D3E7_9ACTN|nr:hypothetical protein [Streptomyces marincola]ARQ71515.1 hypothetical protein CAG99_24195 [Streptomyces marincola]